jgi:hypothetical protein
LFFTTELLSGVGHVIAVYCFASIWGLVGTGIAFMTLYVFSTLIMLVVVRGLVGATWSRHSFSLALLSTTVMAILMFNCSFNLNPLGSWVINLAILSLVTYGCLMQLSSRSGIGWNSLLARFRFATTSE